LIKKWPSRNHEGYTLSKAIESYAIGNFTFYTVTALGESIITKQNKKLFTKEEIDRLTSLGRNLS